MVSNDRRGPGYARHAVELTPSQNAAFERKLSRGVVLVLCATFALGVLTLIRAHTSPLGGALVAASIAAAVLRPWRLTSVTLWLASAVFFVAFVAVVGASVLEANAARTSHPKRGNQVLSAEQSVSYLATKGVSPEHSLYVPTGIYLTHMEFQSANNVAVSGYVWQRYAPNTPKDLQKGVAFPEAVNGGYDDMQQAYDVIRPDGSEILGWHFDLTFRQRFDYAKFPFDQQDVWIRMWDRDFERGGILVPDFAAYPPWVPAETIGLEKQFVYSGWTPIFTGFGYLENTYASTFGVRAYQPEPPFPELVYTTSLRRVATGPFVANVMPLMVTYVLTFAILLFMVKDDDRSFNILSALTGLFFITLLNHQQISTVASADGLSFLGLASGIMYVTFFAIAANGLIVARMDVPFFEWRHNLLPKLLFLPVTSFVLALVSLRVL